MNEAQAIELISSTFAATWPAASGRVPFQLENRAFESPPGDRFALLTTQHTTSALLTTGARGGRFVGRYGWITVKLWGPAGAGRAGIATLTDAVRGIFELQNLTLPAGGEPIATDVSVTQELGVDSRWFMALVRTPFSYYETK